MVGDEVEESGGDDTNESRDVLRRIEEGATD